MEEQRSKICCVFLPNVINIYLTETFLTVFYILLCTSNLLCFYNKQHTVFFVKKPVYIIVKSLPGFI